MRKKRSDKLPEFGTLYTCLGCPENPVFDPNKFKDHLQATHGIQVSTATKKMTMHLDCEGYFVSGYDVVINDTFKAAKSVCGPRGRY